MSHRYLVKCLVNSSPIIHHLTRPAMTLGILELTFANLNYSNFQTFQICANLPYLNMVHPHPTAPHCSGSASSTLAQNCLSPAKIRFWLQWEQLFRTQAHPDWVEISETNDFYCRDSTVSRNPSRNLSPTASSSMLFTAVGAAFSHMCPQCASKIFPMHSWKSVCSCS